MIRWLRGETVGDLCRESALISCAMAAERIFCPFSVGCSLFILSNVSLSFCQLFLFSSISCFSLLRQLFLFSFHWILLFSCRRRLCALSFTAHFYPVRTSWCEYHVELSAAYLFLTFDLHFLYAQSVILGQGVDLFVVSGR